jgi:hypothetical protein
MLWSRETPCIDADHIGRCIAVSLRLLLWEVTRCLWQILNKKYFCNRECLIPRVEQEFPNRIAVFISRAVQFRPHSAAVKQVVLGHLKRSLILRLDLKDVFLGGHHSCSSCPCLCKEFGEQHGSAVKAHLAVLQAMTVYCVCKTGLFLQWIVSASCHSPLARPSILNSLWIPIPEVEDTY